MWRGFYGNERKETELADLVAWDATKFLTLCQQLHTYGNGCKINYLIIGVWMDLVITLESADAHMGSKKNWCWVMRWAIEPN